MTEEYLSTTIQEWHTAFDAVNDAIWIVSHDRCLLRANKTAGKIFNIPTAEMIGKHWRELGLVAEILEPFEAQVRECFGHGLSFIEQVTYPTVFGDRTYEYNLNPVHDDTGNIACVLAIVRAVSPR